MQTRQQFVSQPQQLQLLPPSQAEHGPARRPLPRAIGSCRRRQPAPHDPGDPKEQPQHGRQAHDHAEQSFERVRTARCFLAIAMRRTGQRQRRFASGDDNRDGSDMAGLPHGPCGAVGRLTTAAAQTMIRRHGPVRGTSRPMQCRKTRQQTHRQIRAIKQSFALTSSSRGRQRFAGRQLRDSHAKFVVQHH